MVSMVNLRMEMMVHFTKKKLSQFSSVGSSKQLRFW